MQIKDMMNNKKYNELLEKSLTTELEKVLEINLPIFQQDSA